MKRRNRKRVKRWLALVLCLSMVFPSATTFVSAAGEPVYTGGLCEHHTEHTAECGYTEAVEGQACSHTHDEACGYSEPTEKIPCTHQHDENCAYQAVSEGSPCTHIHDEACGYKEAMAGSPCTYICEICSGEQNMQPLSEDDIVISLVNPMGYAGQEYNLLEKAAVSPEQDGEGHRIQLRIINLQADLANAVYEWENPVLHVAEEQTVNFTVTYEAYVQAEDGGQVSEQILATKELTFSVYAAGEIGKRLEGDNAYISNAYLTRDDSTESKLAIRTGTAPLGR